MVVNRDPRGMVSGHPWAAPKVGAMAKAAVVVLVLLVAACWPVARFEASQSSESCSAAEMATRASTRDQPGRGDGCRTHEGPTAAERPRYIGRERVRGSPMVRSSTRENPASRSGASCGHASSRMRSISSTFPKSVGSIATGIGGRAEGNGSCSGPVDQTTRGVDESTNPRTHAARHDASAARPDCGTSSVAGSCGTIRTRSTARSRGPQHASIGVGGIVAGSGRIEDLQRSVPGKHHVGHQRGGPGCREVHNDGEHDRRCGLHSERESVQPSGMRCVGAKYGLRGIRVGETSHPGPSRNTRIASGAGQTQIEVSSEDEPLVHPDRGGPRNRRRRFSDSDEEMWTPPGAVPSDVFRGVRVGEARRRLVLFHLPKQILCCPLCQTVTPSRRTVKTGSQRANQTRRATEQGQSQEGKQMSLREGQKSFPMIH